MYKYVCRASRKIEWLWKKTYHQGTPGIFLTFGLFWNNKETSSQSCIFTLWILTIENLNKVHAILMLNCIDVADMSSEPIHECHFGWELWQCNPCTQEQGQEKVCRLMTHVLLRVHWDVLMICPRRSKVQTDAPSERRTQLKEQPRACLWMKVRRHGARPAKSATQKSYLIRRRGVGGRRFVRQRRWRADGPNKKYGSTRLVFWMMQCIIAITNGIPSRKNEDMSVLMHI